MKIKHFFAVVAVTLLFAGCVKEGIVDESGINDPNATGWVSFRVNTPTQSFTRGVWWPGSVAGTQSETTVTEFYAIFFDETGNVVHSLLIGNSDPEFGNPNQLQGDAGEAFQVPITSKRILIVANPSTKFKAQLAGATTFAAINAVIADEDVSEISTPGKFMMTNAKGGLEPSNANGSDRDLVLYNSKSNAEASPLSINVDRVVAKIRVFIEQLQEQNDAPSQTRSSERIRVRSSSANIYDAGWQVNVTNKKYYPVSKRVKTFFELTSRGCITPFDQYKLGSYRVDPNYNSVTQPALGDTDNYNYIDPNPNNVNWITPLALFRDDLTLENQVYCLENTHEKQYNQWGYTTQVIFKAEFAPIELRVPTGGHNGGTPIVAGELYTGPGVIDGEVQQGTDWIMVNGGYYTWDLLVRWIEYDLGYRLNYDREFPETSIHNITLLNALNTYLEETGIAEPINLPSYPLNWEDDALYLDILTQLENLKGVVEAHGADRVGQFTYYKGGVSYYPIMIKHDDLNYDEVENAVNEFGKFGVVRNSVYDITIVSVNNPGYPTIPPPTDTPNESEQNWLSVKIDVNPWTWYLQFEEL